MLVERKFFGEFRGFGDLVFEKNLGQRVEDERRVSLFGNWKDKELAAAVRAAGIAYGKAATVQGEFPH